MDSGTRRPLPADAPVAPAPDPAPLPGDVPTPGHVELCAASAFSFLAGASTPEELVAQSVSFGLPMVGVADLHGVYGLPRAYAECKRLNARLICGATLMVECPGQAAHVVVVHVMHRAGWARLCRIITRGHLGRPKGVCVVPLEDLCAVADGLWCTVLPPGLDAVTLGIPDVTHPTPWPAPLPPVTSDAALRRLKEAFGHRLSTALVRRMSTEDARYAGWSADAQQHLGIPPLATTRPLMHAAHKKPAQDVLTCIRLGVTLWDAGRLLLPNAEARVLSGAEMAARYLDVPHALRRTLEVAASCTFSLAELRYRFPADRLMPGETPMGRLRALTWEGARRRYGGMLSDAVQKQLLHELALIEKIDVAPYFLTVHDIVETARARRILCQGRGSAANSAVCYVLGITSVDPVHMQLLFERFLSVERGEPPDIDVDFEHERREEVIQDIYQRWGRQHAGMVNEVICYRGRSAIREAGKVVGLDPDTLDRVGNLMIHSSLSDVKQERMDAVGVPSQSPEVALMLRVARMLQGVPRHLGIHVGGFVLTHDPLVDTVPVEPASMEDRTIIQWDKDDLDTLGIFKMDVLALGMLTAIRKTMDMVRQHGGTAYELWSIPPDDPDTYAAIQKADTVGVFQIESRAQMAMLPRLKPCNFYDLVVEVAIVRPGPIQGDMVHPYLRRRRGEDPVDYPHESLVPVLQRTLGVPLFQEQVMKLAVIGAGYTPGEADQLRRDMAAWKKTGRLMRHKDKLMQGFTARGIAPDFADRLFAQIQGFGEYGFPESHAASFALLTYASSYLKTHHPAAFTACLLNSQPMGFYSASSLIQDVQRHGVEVRPVEARWSAWDCTLERRDDGGLALRLGFRLIKGIRREHAEAWVHTRDRLGGAVTLAAFMGAAPWRPAEVQAITGSGALDALAGGRREALWEALGVDVGSRQTARRTARLTSGLKTTEQQPSLPGMTALETLVLDYRHTGLSLKDHPMRHLRAELQKRQVVTCGELGGIPHGRTVKVAGLVVTRQRPGTASGVVFVTLEDESGTANVVVWNHVFERFLDVARSAGMMEVRGRLERDGDVIHVIAQHMVALELPAKGIRTESRDFH